MSLRKLLALSALSLGVSSVLPAQAMQNAPATLGPVPAAMLAYEASEDPNFIDRTKSPGTWPADWPALCGKAPRVTKPRY